MSRFRVLLTREATESATVEVEANNPELAETKALEKAGPYGQNLDTWEVDEGNFPEVYVTGPDCVEEL